MGTELDPISKTFTGPVPITEPIDPLAPAAGSGTASDLILTAVSSTLSDTFSSPFVVYTPDIAYVGNDTGTLFRVKNVFCTVDPTCTGLTPPAPSLDSNWNLTGVLSTGCPGKLTSPVVASTGNVFVGCSDGTLYGFTNTGAALLGSPLTVGNGGATGGIVDAPIVDEVNGFVYVVSGNSLGGSSVLVQASATNLSASVTVTLGAGGKFNLHAPAFNNAYFSASFASVSGVQGTSAVNSPTGTTSNWQIYEWGVSGVSTSPATLYGVGFANTRVMTSGAASNFLQIAGSVNTEFSRYRINECYTDQSFASALRGLRFQRHRL